MRANVIQAMTNNTRQTKKAIADIAKQIQQIEEILYSLIDRLRLEIHEDGSLRLVKIRKQKCTRRSPKT